MNGTAIETELRGCSIIPVIWLVHRLTKMKNVTRIRLTVSGDKVGHKRGIMDAVTPSLL